MRVVGRGVTFVGLILFLHGFLGGVSSKKKTLPAQDPARGFIFQALSALNLGNRKIAAGRNASIFGRGNFSKKRTYALSLSVFAARTSFQSHPIWLVGSQVVL